MLKKIDTTKRSFRIVMLLLGNILYAMAINLFLVGNNIAGGGFAGVATVLHYVFPVFQIGTIVFIMNIPLYIFSFFIKGFEFTISTFLSSLLFSALLNVTSFLPTLTHNPIAAAVFGGVLYGIGMVCLVISKSSVGGTDLLNRLLVTKFQNISVGKMSLFVDGSVVVFAMIMFRDVEVGLYAIITLYVCSIFADKIMSGFDKGDLCIIITDKDDELIAQTLMDKLKRAVTKIDAKGMYSQTDKNVYMIAVTPRETIVVKEIVRNINKNAFVVVTYANELVGGGFKKIIPPPKV